MKKVKAISKETVHSQYCKEPKKQFIVNKAKLPCSSRLLCVSMIYFWIWDQSYLGAHCDC